MEQRDRKGSLEVCCLVVFVLLLFGLLLLAFGGDKGVSQGEGKYGGYSGGGIRLPRREG
jgi:hypothetical protein